jgi:hypothetical protein
MFLKNFKSNFLFYSSIAFGYVILRKRTLIQNYISNTKIQYKYNNNSYNSYNKLVFCKTCKKAGKYDLCMSCWIKMLNNEN